MRPLKELIAVADSLRDIRVDSNFELTIIHALVVLERNKGNRTKTSEDLKIAVRTLRVWLKVMEAWGLDVPEYVYDPLIRCKSRKKYPKISNYIRRSDRP